LIAYQPAFFLFTNPMLPCAYKSLLGIDCPMCGGQRSLLLLLKGNIAGSLQMYPPLLPVLFCAALFVIHLLNKKMISAARMKFIASIVLGIIMISYFAKLATGTQ
jgi:Protein of unknown function (DUF2752)